MIWWPHGPIHPWLKYTTPSDALPLQSGFQLKRHFSHLAAWAWDLNCMSTDNRADLTWPASCWMVPAWSHGAVRCSVVTLTKHRGKYHIYSPQLFWRIPVSSPRTDRFTILNAMHVVTKKIENQWASNKVAIIKNPSRFGDSMVLLHMDIYYVSKIWQHFWTQFAEVTVQFAGWSVVGAV